MISFGNCFWYLRSWFLFIHWGHCGICTGIASRALLFFSAANLHVALCWTCISSNWLWPASCCCCLHGKKSPMANVTWQCDSSKLPLCLEILMNNKDVAHFYLLTFPQENKSFNTETQKIADARILSKHKILEELSGSGSMWGRNRQMRFGVRAHLQVCSETCTYGISSWESFSSSSSSSPIRFLSYCATSPLDLPFMMYSTTLMFLERFYPEPWSSCTADEHSLCRSL